MIDSIIYRVDNTDLGDTNLQIVNKGRSVDETTKGMNEE